MIAKTYTKDKNFGIKLCSLILYYVNNIILYGFILIGLFDNFSYNTYNLIINDNFVSKYSINSKIINYNTKNKLVNISTLID